MKEKIATFTFAQFCINFTNEIIIATNYKKSGFKTFKFININSKSNAKYAAEKKNRAINVKCYNCGKKSYFKKNCKSSGGGAIINNKLKK